MVIVSNDWHLNDGDTKAVPNTNSESTLPSSAAASEASSTTTSTLTPATRPTATTPATTSTLILTTTTTAAALKTPEPVSEKTITTSVDTIESVAVSVVQKQRRDTITGPNDDLAASEDTSKTVSSSDANKAKQPTSNNNSNDKSPCIMDIKCKSDDSNMSVHEKHESETNSCEPLSLASGELSSVTFTNCEFENNNLEYEQMLANEVNTSENAINSNSNSNTNTLQSSLRQSLTATVQPQSLSRESTQMAITKPFTQQALNSAINSVQTPSSGGQLFSQMDYLSSNGALQQQQQTAKLSYSSEPQTQTQTQSLIVTTPADVGEVINDSSIDNSGEAKIILLCQTKSHPFNTRTILLKPGVDCKVGRLIAKSKAYEDNAIFDCKVLSRNHALLWYSEDGKFWVKDTKSSNGTFINENKLGNEPAELHCDDVVKFGVDVMENSRKEVHGCIIAQVKLYLPDGRESISIDAHTQRMNYSGANRINYDEMQRLNAFMQEAAQREKVLKQKLSSLQNVLDTTRKNSALCWQSMITEDQLLHKINLLEKKLQIMEKNVPENSLRNEIMKLLDDKNAYQLTAKEALRKVYQERCDALQILAKKETALTTAQAECSLLREQLSNESQFLSEANERLHQVESEYFGFEDEAVRLQKEAKMQAEQQIAELQQQLVHTERHCTALTDQVTQLKQQLAQHVNSDKLQEQQAIANLDATIADMDIGDDDDDEDEDEGEGEEYGNGSEAPDVVAMEDSRNVQNKLIKKHKRSKAEQAILSKAACDSPVMKLLQNSNLSKDENATDVINAMYNDSDSGDEQDSAPVREENSVDGKQFEKVCTKFTSILENVQLNLQRVEDESNNLTSSEVGTTGGDSDDDTDDKQYTSAVANHEFEVTGALNLDASPKDSKNYQLLKESVFMLRDAFNEICQQKQHEHRSVNSDSSLSPTQSLSPIPTNPNQKKLIAQDTLVDQQDVLLTGVGSGELLPEQAIDMLQEECDSWKAKVADLNTMVSQLREQKEALEQAAIEKNKSLSASQNVRICAGTAEATISTTDDGSHAASTSTTVAKDDNDECSRFEDQLSAEIKAASMQSNELEQQEEELIMYKERLEQSESYNLSLRNEISQLKLQTRGPSYALMRRALPLGAVVVAALVYLLAGRF